MRSRAGVGLVLVALLAALLAAALSVVATPADAARAGTLRVTVVAPKGVATKVVATHGKKRVGFVKPAAVGSKTVARKVARGTWRVSGARVRFKGRFYVASVKPAKAKVRSGRTTKVKVVYRMVPVSTPTTVPTAIPTTVPTTAPTTTPPPQVGDAYAGGVYAGTTQDDDGRQYALVASPREMQFAVENVYWDKYSHSHGGQPRSAPKASLWDGLANTQAAAAVDTDYMVFDTVGALSAPADEGSPWYVPAKNELAVLWTAFGESGLSFVGSTNQIVYLWSSTQDNPGFAWAQDIRDSQQGYQFSSAVEFNYGDFGVRPVRRIAD